MAYHKIQGTVTGRSAFFAIIKDFLVNTVGWTLHDENLSVAQPWFIVKSVGESGAEDIYLRFLIATNSGQITVAAFQYWNATTHAGVNEGGYSYYTYIKVDDSAEFIYWLFGDKDHLFTVNRLVSTYYGQYCGLIKRFWSSAIALTLESLTSGANKTVQVNDASVLSANKFFIIRDNANIERVKITAIDTVSVPNTVTIENLVRAYTADAKIGEDPQPVIVGYYYSPGQFYSINKYDGYSSVTGQDGRCGAAHGGLAADSDPEMRYGNTLMFPWLVAMSGTEIRGELIEVYAIGGGNTASEDTIQIDDQTYRVFNLYNAGWCAVKE